MNQQTNHKTLFFDLDGTLTDPKEGITRSIQYALERLGKEIPSADALEWCIGPPLLDSMASLAGEQAAEIAVAYYRERFSDIGWAENIPYDGIHRTLEALRHSGARLYVATSKPHVFAQRILEHFELISFFSGVYGSELDGTRSNKGELLQYALDNTQPTQPSIMIGDRSHDMIGARSNDMQAIGVTYGYGTYEELQSSGAHKIVNAPNELCTILI